MKTIYMSADGTWVQDWSIEPEGVHAFPEEPDDLWSAIQPDDILGDVLVGA